MGVKAGLSDDWPPATRHSIAIDKIHGDSLHERSTSSWGLRNCRLCRGVAFIGVDVDISARYAVSVVPLTGAKSEFSAGTR
jgi:hypothetical protein